MGAKYEYCARGIAFGTVVILLEITFFVLYCVLVKYGSFSVSQFIFPFYNNTNFTNNTCCSPFCNLDQSSIMVLLGLGCFFSAIRCTSFSAIGFILFIFAVTIQWAGLVIPWLFQAAMDFFQPQYIYMNTAIICDVIYCAFALSIAHGVLVGIVSRIQMVIIIIFGVVLFAVDRLVVIHYLYVSDVGGSITVYMFGGLFGLAILYTLFIKQRNWCCIFKCDRDGTYYQYLFAFLGTLFLIVFWPRFISNPFPSQSDLRERALVNTIYSITAAVIISFAISSFVTKCCKLTILHVICGSISGAIIVGSVAPLFTQVWGAILLGAFSGFITVVMIRYVRCYRYARPDIYGVFWTFAFAGFVGGVASAIMADLVYDTEGTLTLSELILIYPAIVYGNLGAGSPRTAGEQGGYQMLGVLVAMGISIGGGILVGIIIRWLGPLEDDEYYNDSTSWRLCGCSECCNNTCEKKANNCERVTIPPI